MGQRPRLLSFLGWFFLVGNLVAIVVILVLWNQPDFNSLLSEGSMPAWWYKAQGLALSAAMAATGYGILNGLDWSRYLYIGVHAVSMLFDYIVDERLPDRPVVLLFIAASSTCLFLPASNRWFGYRRRY